MARADVDEVNVEPVDRRHELRIGIELGLRLSPVVVRSPVAHELLKLREPHALRSITDSLAVGPPRREDAAPQVDEYLLGNVDAERTDCAVLAWLHAPLLERGWRHPRPPSSQESRAG